MAIPPVIILGMHRSGTTLLVRLLESLGLFAGHSKEGNQESRFFLGLNQWIMSETNAAWDNPYCFRFLNSYLHDRMTAFLEGILASKDRINFLGPGLASRYPDIRNLDIPWGWKDPRNTFTIDVWNSIFPNAKVIHISRNPVDVAVSLKIREENRKKAIDRIIAENGINTVIERGLKIQTSVRVENLNEGIKLWFEYTDKALTLHHRFRENLLTVRYEDLLEHPLEQLQSITDFSGLAASRTAIETTLKQLNPARKYAFLESSDLVNLYNAIRDQPVMHELGYNKLID
jgi:hypothetical protein